MKTKAALKKCFVHFPVEKFNKVVAPITKKKKMLMERGRYETISCPVEHNTLLLHPTAVGVVYQHD